MSRPVKELHDRQSTVKHDGNGSISAIAMEMAGKLEVELGNFFLLHFSYLSYLLKGMGSRCAFLYLSRATRVI